MSRKRAIPPCGLSREELSAKEWLSGQRCAALCADDEGNEAPCDYLFTQHYTTTPHSRSAARSMSPDDQFASHYCPLLGGMYRLIVTARIINISTNSTIEVPLHIDSGLQCADLMLLQEDVVALGLNPSTIPNKIMYQPDETSSTLTYYERVKIELDTNIDTLCHISLDPVVMTPNPANRTCRTSNPTIPGTIENIRKLGFNFLDKLSLKQDFVNNRLVKQVRRI